MTKDDIIKHWRKGAKDSLSAAEILHENGKHDLALFHCHLAVEKALKAAVMEKTGKPHPKIHELFTLAKLLKVEWDQEDKQLFDSLSDFAVAARYDDPAWAQKFATEQNARMWITRVEQFLSIHCP